MTELAPLRPLVFEQEAKKAYLPSAAIDRRSLVRPAGIRPNLAHLDESIDIERPRKLNGQASASERRTRVKV